MSKSQKIKIIYTGYHPPQDKPGWIWHVADDYVPESHRAFWHFVDAEKYYDTLNDKHPRWLHQIPVHGIQEVAGE